jgi:hypothetical protein
MTAEEMRVACAEAMGYRLDNWPGKAKGIVGWRLNGVYVSVLPDYPNDLKAVHEAEKVLTGPQAAGYIKILCELRGVQIELDDDTQIGASELLHLVSAIAADRCTAFLKAVGRWPTGEGKTL